MKHVKSIGVAALLWAIGSVLSYFIFSGTSTNEGYAVIFTWWFVAYFSRHLVFGLSALIGFYCVSFVVLVLAFQLDLYAHFYHDPPASFSLGFIVVILVHSLIVISPLLFNTLVRQVENILSSRKIV